MLKHADNADAMARAMAELDEGERIRRWRRGMQAGEELQRRLRAAEGPRPAQAVAELFSVLNALEAMGRWPAPLDPVSEQRVAEVRARWARIQRRARAQATTGEGGKASALAEAIAGAISRFQADVRRLTHAALHDAALRLGAPTALARSSERPAARASPSGARTPSATRRPGSQPGRGVRTLRPCR